MNDSTKFPDGTIWVREGLTISVCWAPQHTDRENRSWTFSNEREATIMWLEVLLH
jgi:hypothetical protein